jgi:subtilisin family serine protease
LVTLGIWAQVSVADAHGAGPGEARMARFDTDLRRLAARAPDRRVTVIVQFVPRLSQSRALAIVRRHGGRHVAVIPLIHGVAAQMAARQARKLGDLSVVHAVSLNAPVKSQTVDFDPGHMSTWFNQSASTQNLWNQATGTGVGVAVIDSGVQGDLPDFQLSQSDTSSRVIASAVVNPFATTAGDPYGHGTMVAGLIAGDGGDRSSSDPLFGQYAGAAPGANLISVKIGDDQGNATVLDVLYGLEFAIDNRSAYNIRVINLSLQSDTAQSYKTDPLDAAVEAAWFDGIVVVAAAGNQGHGADAVDYAPGNDPYVITVGAFADQTTTKHLEATLQQQDRQREQALVQQDQQAEQAVADPQQRKALQAHDQQKEQALQRADQQNEQALQQSAGLPASWSSSGTTQDGFAEPDVYAPGAHIVSDLAPASAFASLCPACVTGGQYIMASGTSLAAPIVSGAVADILQLKPSWTPDMVKGALVNTAAPLHGASGKTAPVPGGVAAAGTLNANAALGASPNKLTSDQGLTPNPLVVPGSGGASWDRSSWSRSSWSTAQGALSAPWARSSWSCTCSRTADGGIDPTRSSWSSTSWSVDFSPP